MTVHYYPRPGAAPQVSIFDTNQLASLRKAVTGGEMDANAQEKIAHQFEALMIQQLLKQSRQTASGNGLFDSEAVRMSQSIGDEQLALNLSNPGFGFAQALIDQMRQAQGISSTGLPERTAPEAASTRLPHLRSQVGEAGRMIDAPSLTALIKKLTGPKSIDGIASAIQGAPKHISQFVNKMRDAVQVAAAESGLPEKLIMSQAALESGWGKSEILHDDGSTSHNLFGIKASPNWKGKVVHVMTTEYIDGKMVKMKQPFRAYASYEDSLADYTRLLSENERYAPVRRASTAEEAAKRVQESGYATDPSYADKLISIMAYFDSSATR